MYQRNRNLFSFVAVLITAGLITGIGGIFLLLIDQVGNGPQLVANPDAIPSLPPASETLGMHASTVLHVSAADNAPLVASGSYDNSVKLWDRNSQEAVSLPHGGRVNDLSFTPDGALLVTGSGAGNIRLWYVPSGELAASMQSGAGRILSLAIADTNQTTGQMAGQTAGQTAGQVMATGSSNGRLDLWTITEESTLARLRTLVEVGPQINALAFHPIDDAVLVSGDQDGVVRVWDTVDNTVIRSLDAGVDRVVSVAISANGRYIASGSYDRTVRVWDLETGSLLQTLTGHDFVVSDVAFSPDGTLLVSSSYDESLKVWEWERALTLCTLKGHSGFVYSVDFTDSGNTLVSGGYDGTVRSWDLTTPKNQACLPQ